MGSGPARRLEAVVHGRVQNVGFREFVRHEATTRGIGGWVRNSDDGRAVELVAEGEASAIDALVVELHRGPRFARVDRVDAVYCDPTGGFGKFSVEM